MKSFTARFLTLVHTACIAVVACLVIVLYGCKEEGDEDPPRIFISDPFENQPISSIDTFLVSATITDNERVAYVEIDLLDQNFSTVTDPVRFNTSGTEVEFGYEWYFNEPFLTSGPYYFAVRAGDGENTSSAYKQVNVSAIPRQIDQFVAVTYSFNNVDIYKGSSLQNWDHLLNSFVDFQGAALNYRQNIIGVAAGLVGDAHFYNLDEGEIQISYTNLGDPSIPYFRGLDYNHDTENFILLQDEPRARVLDKNAEGLYAANLFPGFRPVRSFDFGNEYFLYEKRVTADQYVLSEYAKAGLLLSSYATSGPVIGVFEKDIDQFFLWEDGAEGVELAVLTRGSELIAPVYSRPGETLKAVVEIENGVFVFSTDQGLYRYNYSNGGTAVLNTSISPETLLYEELDGVFYATSG
ncbi:MAG: hypothetical protein LC664_14975, partial [Flavobacteriales bacterium]|nr:hypothetical protein [Flavobacteriales bacterium]